MKTEEIIKEEVEKLKKKMLEVSNSEGLESFRFIHLSVASLALNWVLDQRESVGHSPVEMDDTFDLLQKLKRQREKNFSSGNLQDLLEAIKKGDTTVEKIEVIGKDAPPELIEKLKSVFKTAEVHAKQQNNDPDFASVLEEIKQSREIKLKRKEEDITKTKEFKALAKKLKI